MQGLILVIHVIACFLLILLVLLQSGKEGMGVIFGGGSSSLFGSTGAGGLLVKLTAVVATVFLITSIAFNVLSTKAPAEKSIMTDVETSAPAPDEAAPAPAEGE